MRVNIDEIKDRVGLERTWEMSREQVDLVVKDDRAGYRAEGPARVEVHFEKLNRRVLLRGRTSAELNCPCGRCLAPMTVKVPVSFQMTLVPADEYVEVEQARQAHGERHDRGEARVAGSFDAKEADEETYSGKVIDIEPILREQMLLALPGYPVCREGCKGLCPVCGANLNDRDCGCDRHVPDPRWAGLKNVKLQ